MHSRRRFLQSTATLLVGCTSASASRSTAISHSPQPERAAAPAPSSSAAPASDVSAHVARATRDTHEEALAAAIDGAGGLGFIREGDTVFVKVNTNSGDPYPYSSSPVAVRWLAREIRSRGGRPVFGDRSFWGDAHTSRNFDTNGIRRATEEAGAELVVLDDAIEWIELDPAATPHWVGPVRVPRLALDAPILVDLACAKTHFISGATLALKNFIGLVHADDRRREGNLRTHDRALLSHQITDLHRGIRAQRAHHRAALYVVDGFRALVTGGPTPASGDGPTIVDAKTVIASADPIACDVAGIHLLQEHAPPTEAIYGVDAWDHPTVRAAIEGRIADARKETTTIARV